MVAVGVLLHPLPYIRVGQGKRGKVLREKTLPDDQPCNMVTCLLGLCEQEFCRIPWVGSALASVTQHPSVHQSRFSVFCPHSTHSVPSLDAQVLPPSPLTQTPAPGKYFCSHSLPLTDQ